MALYTGMDLPPGRAYTLFWKAVFFILLGLVIWGGYLASVSVDYIWRWHKVPQYFYYIEKIEITSPVAGEVASVTSKQGRATLVLRGENGEEEQLASKGRVLVSEGDFISPGDVLIEYEQGTPGVLLTGLWITLKVSLLSIIFGMVAGLLTGLARICDNPVLKWSAITYIELVRGSPLLVQMFLWYFVVGTLVNSLLAKQGLPPIPSLWFGVLSLGLFAGAYIAEIVRAGIQSVHKGQVEAARSLGMTSTQAMCKIILPQAFRRVLPPLAGQFISLIKDSSLLGVIAIRELTKTTRETVSTSLQPFELWIVCAILYLVLTFALSMFVQYLERRAL